MAPISKNCDFNLRRDRQKKSYDCHDYESVNKKKRAYLRLCPENRGKNNSGTKGLRKLENGSSPRHIAAK